MVAFFLFTRLGTFLNYIWLISLGALHRVVPSQLGFWNDKSWFVKH